MKKSLVLSIRLALLASLVACNLPANQTQSADEMGTAAALTVQAALVLLNSPTAGSVSATPAIASTATFTSIPGTQNAIPSATQTATPITLTPTLTPTYSVPMITINESTNCRTGPGQNYEIIYTFLPGVSTQIVAQYPQDNYWVVKLPHSSNTCWLWGGYASVTGSFWVVPTTTLPPTTTPIAPNAPTGLSWTHECGASITVTLNWTDRSEGEEGFRVLRDGAVVAQLPPNTTTYVDVFFGVATQKYSYAIEVFSGNLTARSGSISFSCQ